MRRRRTRIELLARLALSQTTPPPLSHIAHPDHRYVEQENNSCNHTVRDLAFDGIAGQLQAQAAIDGAEDEQAPTEPDVAPSPESAALGALINVVVDKAQDRLKHEKSDDADTDNRVSTVKLQRTNTDQPSLITVSRWVEISTHTCSVVTAIQTPNPKAARATR